MKGIGFEGIDTMAVKSVIAFQNNILYYLRRSITELGDVNERILQGLWYGNARDIHIAMREGYRLLHKLIVSELENNRAVCMGIRRVEESNLDGLQRPCVMKCKQIQDMFASYEKAVTGVMNNLPFRKTEV